MNERTVRMSELHGRVVIDAADNYVVDLPDTEDFIVVAGANYPDAATRYDHPNIAAKQDLVFETRAYWPDGRKKWFQHAGRDFFFVIPRHEIELIFEKGYSYVPVRINGYKLCLNVSGGTLSPKGWADRVRPQVHVGIGFTIKKLALLAAVALPPASARGKIELELAELEEHQPRNFTDLVAAHDVRKMLATGGKIMLADGCSYDDKQGPFEVLSKPSRNKYYLCQSSLNTRFGFRAYYRHIDWTETAKANDIRLVEPTRENRLASTTACAAMA